MRSLKAARSSMVRESDLAITGTTLTTSESFFKTTMSIGLRLYIEISDSKYKEQYSDVRVSGGLDEEQAAVNAGVLDVALTLSSELLTEVGGVLVLDVLHDGVPASVVVNLVAVSRGVDNVKAQSHAVLLNDWARVRQAA